MTESMEIEAYGRTYDFGDFAVEARCFAVPDNARRLELRLQACGRKAVIDLSSDDRRIIRDLITQAATAFADCIRLSRRS